MKRLPLLVRKLLRDLWRTRYRGAAVALLLALKGRRNVDVPLGHVLRQLGVALLPALVFALVAAFSWHLNTRPAPVEEVFVAEPEPTEAAPASGGLAEPPAETGSGGLQEPPAASGSCRSTKYRWWMMTFLPNSKASSTTLSSG